LGKVEAYQEACARLHEDFSNSEDRVKILLLCRILILSPKAIADSASLVQLSQKALQLWPDNWWSRHVLGGAYIRDGQYEEALQTFDEIDRLKLVPPSPSVDSCLSQILNDSLRVIALVKLGRAAEAKSALDRVLESSELHLKSTPELPFGEITPCWWNWYPVEAFRNEAAALLREFGRNT
jgi:pentatricopeptide repeat protein